MRRALGGLMLLVAGFVAPSVIIWALGAPWWGWLAVVGVLVGAGLISIIGAIVIEWLDDKLGTFGTLGVGMVLLCLLVIPGSLGFPWWGGFAVAGGIVGFLGLLRIAFEGLLIMVGADKDG